MKRLLTILILFQTTVIIRGHYQADFYSVHKGFLLSAINCIYQDKAGFLWMGTRDGLVRYDGYKFKNYQYQYADSTSLPGNNISSITGDTAGNLYLLANHGLIRYNSQTGAFTNLTRINFLLNRAGHSLLFDVHMSEGALLWIRTNSGLVTVDCSNGKYVIGYPLVIADHEMVSFGAGTLLEFDGRVYTFSNKTIYYSDLQNSGTIPFETTRYGNISGVFTPDAKQLGVITTQGVFIIDARGQAVPVNTKPANGKGVSIAIPVAPSGYLLAQSERMHLSIEGQSEDIPAAHLQVNKYHNYFTRAFVDKAGNVWAGGQSGLLKISKTDSIYFTGQVPLPFAGDKLVTAYLEADGNQYFGTVSEGLWVWYNNLQRGQQLTTGTEPVRQLTADRLGGIFAIIGTKLFRYDGRELAPVQKVFPFVPDSVWVSQKVNCISSDHTGSYWVGTSHRLIHVDIGTQEYKIYSVLKNNIRKVLLKEVKNIRFSSDGKVVLSMEDGLMVISSDFTSFELYSGEDFQFKSNRLSSKIINDIYIDKKDNIWIATSNGLNLLDPGERVFVFTRESGIGNNAIYRVLPDSADNLWLPTNQGILKYDQKQAGFISFHQLYGFQVNEHTRFGCNRRLDGSFFFSGSNGQILFYPDSLVSSVNQPVVHITEITEVSRKGIHELFPVRGTIRIGYNKAFLSIDLSVLDFNKPYLVKYAYRINQPGNEGAWIYIDNKHEVSLGSLLPGEYTFEAKATNEDHIWSKEVTSLRIRVVAPFWNSRWAYFAYFLLALIATIFLYIARTRNIRKLKKEYKERERISQQISRQKEELIQKNKNITDSINYAKRIQEAMMPSKALFDKFLPESFVLHKPKDIVSGDFYWINEKKGKIFVAAVDCTGHGVPGAFMSIIGFELFRKITGSQGVEEPAHILNILNDNFAEIFRDVHNFTLKDGMDIALCVIDKKRNVVEFSGAFNPLYLVRDNTISEVRGDRFSVGLEDGSDEAQRFTNHSIPLEKADVLYIFTDGFADQFGGPEGKKFKYRRFRHILLTIHKLPMSLQAEVLEQTIDEWRGSLEQIDDILIIGFKPYSDAEDSTFIRSV